jgi:hypothetical protein
VGFIAAAFEWFKEDGTTKETRHFFCRLSDYEMKLLAHELFERGYMTGENDCFGGSLEYVERK